MSVLGIILLIVILAVIFGGIGPWAPRGYGYGYGGYGIGLPGILLVILIILLVFGKL
jgi:hypothetical protein